MFDRSKTQLGVAVFIFIAILASLSYLFVIVKYHRDIPFLSTSPEANWIRYYLYPDTVIKTDDYIDFATDFTKDFTLNSVPPKAELRIKGFKKYRLWINNGEFLRGSTTQTNWKKIDTLDISQLLRKGKNTIRVEVMCDYGPPALWLYTRGLQDDIRTDTTWSVSISGSPYFAAGLANDCFVHPAGSDGPRPLRSLVAKFPMLVLFFCISCAVFCFHIYKQKSTKPDKHPVTRFFIFTPQFVLIVSIILWTVVFISNAPQIQFDCGFDAEHHLNYIQYLLEHHTVPLANEGFQAYQPPLFYTLSALLLSAAKLIFPNETAYMMLKIIPFLCGVGQILVVYFSSRIVFPSSTSKQSLSVVFAALIPMNIYISHYVSNESLCAFLIGLLILVTIIMLSQGSSAKLFCILGVLVGLALLTKFTVLIVLPVVALTLLYKLISEERRSLAGIVGYFGLMAAVATGLAGWFYLRNWINFGKFLVGNWDPVSGMYWWQDPGFHTYKYFCQFGKVFSVPYLSGFYSFFDSIYASFWGDSLLGGGTLYIYGPPWNYEYTSAVYILALLATLVIMIGTVRAVSAAVFRANKIWLLIFGTLFVAGFGIAYMNLRVPYYAQAKAFYSLFVVLPVALTFSFGFDGLDGWLRDKGLLPVRIVLYGWFGTLALAIFFSFLVSPAQKHDLLDISAFAREGRLNEAVIYYTQFLDENPNSHCAHNELAMAYTYLGKYDDAGKHYKKALHLIPDWPRTLNNLSVWLNNKPNATALERAQAVRYAERYCQLTGYLRSESLVTLANAYAAVGNFTKAVKAAEEAIKLAETAGKKNLAEKIQERLDLYKSGQPYHDK